MERPKPFPAMILPWTTSECPNITNADLISPNESARRMPVDEIVSPSFCAQETTSTAIPNCRKYPGVPTPPWPKRQLSPQRTVSSAPLPRPTIRGKDIAKSAALCDASAGVNSSAKTFSTPSSFIAFSLSSKVIINSGTRCGERTVNG